MINQAPIVRYTASVSETFFPNSWRKTFSAESVVDLILSNTAAPTLIACPVPPRRPRAIG